MSASIARPRRRFWPYLLGTLALVIVLLVLFWNWDWFIPLVDARASAALGRRVTIAHLHVKLGRRTTITLDDLQVANPDGFDQTAPLARIGQLTIVADAMRYIHDRIIVLPEIGIAHADIAATADQDGRNNFTIKPGGTTPNAPPSAPPQIGDLTIADSHVHFVDPRVKSNFTMDVATTPADASRASTIVVAARGTYAGQPVTGNFVGGALLSLRDVAHPYPIDVHIANGDTKVSLVGTVQNPLNFAGARVKLSLSGSDMNTLFPITGVPIPHTPPFSIAGSLDYLKPRIRFTDFQGRVGSSDLEGTVTENPGIDGKPDVIMDLASRRVDLTDLGGFIGTPAGKASTRETSAAKTRARQGRVQENPVAGYAHQPAEITRRQYPSQISRRAYRE